MTIRSGANSTPHRSTEFDVPVAGTYSVGVKWVNDLLESEADPTTVFEMVTRQEAEEGLYVEANDEGLRPIEVVE